ncbi:MAG: DNA polymerase-3 subunit delta' [Gammaproteobacteria bacterium]|jgi:DNA polymerase-3 subunit delta'
MEAQAVTASYLPWQSDLLERAMSLKLQQRLPHAILIESSSTRDVSEFIYHLSMLLLCDHAQENQFCGECESCSLMLNSTYADFNSVGLEYDSKTKKLNKNIKIEQIRDIIHELHLTPRFERLKIATIYPAEKMSHAAANSLLKTLEEPADRVLLLLVTHNQGRIPVTLRSRCQIWTMKPAKKSEAMDWLEQKSVEADEVSRYLEFAGGDPLLALHLKDQDYAGLVADFKPRFVRYIRGDLPVSSLVQNLKAFELPSIRRLLDMIFAAYCYQFSGIDSAGNAAGSENRAAVQALTSLKTKAQRQLMIEENNLDLQLQLEDVLISCKQIITRRSS